jgi:hypothetical protein
MPVGTTAAILGAAAIGAGATVYAGSQGASAQQKAAKTAANIQKQQFEQTRADLSPYRDVGSNALSRYQNLLGMNGQEKYQSSLNDYQQSPFLSQLVKDTQRGVDASSAARGGLFSGATAQAIGDRTGQLYLGDFNNYLSRVGGLVDTGVGAATTTGNFGANAASGQANAATMAGNARAGGYINMANGVNNALSQGASLYGAYKGGAFGPAPAPDPSTISRLPYSVPTTPRPWG